MKWIWNILMSPFWVLLGIFGALLWVTGLTNVDGKKGGHKIFLDLILPGLIAWLAVAGYFLEISREPILQYIAMLVGLRAIWPLGDFKPILETHFPKAGRRASSWIHGAFAAWNAPVILAALGTVQGGANT